MKKFFGNLRNEGERTLTCGIILPNAYRNFWLNSRLATSGWISWLYSLHQWAKTYDFPQGSKILSYLEYYPVSQSIYLSLRVRNDRKVKTVGMQHAMVNRNKGLYCFTKDEAYPLPDEILVYGSLFRAQLEKQGLLASKIFEIGSPRHEGSLSANPSSTAKISVLVASTYDPDDALDLAHLLNEMARNHPDTKFSFRAHPTMAREWFTAQGIDFPSNVEWDSGKLDVRTKSLVLSSYSSVLDEAVVCGTPAASIIFSGSPAMSDFFDLKERLLLDCIPAFEIRSKLPESKVSPELSESLRAEVFGKPKPSRSAALVAEHLSS